MHFDGEGALKFREYDAITTPPQLHGGNDIVREIFGIQVSNRLREKCLLADDEEMDELYRRSSPTGAGSTIFVWAHGNRHRDVIGAGLHTATPDQVLDFLEGCGLKKGHQGDICIWSCWAGVLDGFAHLLAMRCRARGFRSLSVWGSRFVTGTMRDRKPLTLGSETLRALAPEGAAPAALEVHGQFRPTKRDDLNVFRPANLMGIKAKEV